MSVAGRKYLKVGNVMLTLVRVTDLSDLLQVADISARQRLYFSASDNNGQSTLMIKLSPDKKSVQELIVTPAVQCHGQCCQCSPYGPTVSRHRQLRFPPDFTCSSDTGLRAGRPACDIHLYSELPIEIGTRNQSLVEITIVKIEKCLNANCRLCN